MTPGLWFASALSAGALLSQVIAWFMLGDADWAFAAGCASSLAIVGGFMLWGRV